MKLAFWPGLGGGPSSLAEIAPVLAARGIDTVTLDPRYGARASWHVDELAAELAATGADVFAGHSWGGAIAARAAVRSPPRALVLLDGGHISPAEFSRLGAKATLDERVAEIREEHARYRWPSPEAYLDFTRSASPRWNTTIEAMALEGMRREGDDVVPPFDADELEQIVRGYDEFDAAATLAALGDIPALLVAATSDPDHAEVRDELVHRFAELVPRGQVQQVDSPHDVVWGLGPALADLVGDWLAAEVGA